MGVDSTSGAGYPFGARLPAAHESKVVLQALDGKVGAVVSANADTTVTIANGVTLRITGTMTGNHSLTIPITSLAPVERVYLRFDCNCGGFTYTVKEQTSGNTICTLSATAGVKQGFELFWDGTNWRCLNWSSPIGGGSAITVDQ